MSSVSLLLTLWLSGGPRLLRTTDPEPAATSLSPSLSALSLSPSLSATVSGVASPAAELCGDAVRGGGDSACESGVLGAGVWIGRGFRGCSAPTVPGAGM